NGYHNGNGTVSAYSIEQSTGSLTPVPGSPFSVPIDTTKPRFPAPGSMPVSVTTHATATGQALYVADSFQNYIWERSEEHTSELQSLPTISYAVFCLKK